MPKTEIEKRIEELEEIMKTLECGDPRNIEVQNEYKRLMKLKL